MSALAVQSEPPPADQSTFGTKDPVLAATLGNLGFQVRHSIPIMLVVSSRSVIDLVDKKSGRLEDCAHLEFRFEAEVLHEVFGRLQAADVSLAHEIAKLAQKQQTGDASGAELLQLDSFRNRWRHKNIGPSGVNHNPTLLWAVQLMYDQVTNFMVVAVVAKELARDPMIEYSKQLNRGVAFAVQPTEVEPQVQRANEKFFRR